MEDQKGQLNKGVGVGSVVTDGGSVGDFSIGGVGGSDSMAGVNVGIGDGNGSNSDDVAGTSVSDKEDIAQQKVVSLKGEITQSEIEKQKKIEVMKAGAVKLEGKKTKKELEKVKELERLKAKAVRLSADDVETQEQKIQDEDLGKKEEAVIQQKRDKAIGRQFVKNTREKKIGPKTEVGVKKVNNTETQKEKQRMIISPEGRISWEDLVDQKNVVNLKQEDKVEDIDRGERGMPSGKVVNLKEEGVVVNDDEGKAFGKRSNSETSFEKDKKVNKKINFEQDKQATGSQNKNNLSPEEEQVFWEKEKVDLGGLSKEDRIKLQTTPSLASVHWGMDDDLNGEVVEWFKKYNRLPVNIKLGLGDAQVRAAIIKLAQTFGLVSEEEFGELSRIVRDVYVDLIGENEIRRRVMDVLKISSDKVGDFLKGIALIVALVKEVGTEKSLEYFEKLSVDEILEKYPKIAEKDITGGQIAEKNSDKYVEPTLKNWLNDYISRTGADKHNNLERGKYLADSSNIKYLDKGDRKKIEMLARSYDEGIKLVVDPKGEDILWQLHTDESALGINTDKEKRVINHFKIDEAQTVDVDNFMNKQEVASKSNVTKTDLRNTAKDSIIKDEGKKVEKGVLDLSSEIEVEAKK
jgi:hypothetical protein